MCRLYYQTPPAWTETVLADFDSFLPDHAAAEKKASGMALSMVSHYPDRSELVARMTELAVEELSHFREVVQLIYARGLQLRADKKDHYVLGLRAHIRGGSEDYLLDRLLVAGIIEARGAERFGLLADALSDPALKKFYTSIARSETRHTAQFGELAKVYFDPDIVTTREQELLRIEADITAAQKITAALH